MHPFATLPVAESLPDRLQEVVGMPFLFARTGYAEELTIHLGKECADPLPRFPDHVSGTCVVRARDSGWSCRDAGGAFIVGVQPGERPATEEFARMVRRIPIQRGSAVVRSDMVAETRPGGIVSRSLLLYFADGTRLWIYPDPGAPVEEDAVADWEVWTPDGCLLVGPADKVAWEERIQSSGPAS